MEYEIEISTWLENFENKRIADFPWKLMPHLRNNDAFFVLYPLSVKIASYFAYMMRIFE